jgi:hypothetical protein
MSNNSSLGRVGNNRMHGVGDTDPQDPHVFGPPGSGSFPFLIKV